SFAARTAKPQVAILQRQSAQRLPCAGKFHLLGRLVRIARLKVFRRHSECKENMWNVNIAGDGLSRLREEGCKPRTLVISKKPSNFRSDWWGGRCLNVGVY